MAAIDTHSVSAAATSAGDLSWSHAADAGASGVAVWIGVGSGSAALPSSVEYGGAPMTYVQTAENANGGSRGTIHLYELSGLQELSLGGTQTISATGLPEPSAFNPNIGAAVSAIGGNPANALSDVAQVEASPFVDGLLPVSISSSEDEFGAAFMFGTMQSDTPAASDGAATLYAVGDLGSVNHAAALIAKAGPITKLEFSNSFTTNLVSSIAVAFSSASGFKAAWALGANQVIQ